MDESSQGKFLDKLIRYGKLIEEFKPEITSVMNPKDCRDVRKRSTKATLSKQEEINYVKLLKKVNRSVKLRS